MPATTDGPGSQTIDAYLARWNSWSDHAKVLFHCPLSLPALSLSISRIRLTALLAVLLS